MRISGVPAPVTVKLSEIDGTTVGVWAGGFINLAGDDETFSHWAAEIADPELLTFRAGREEKTARFNPGLSAHAEGTTEVTLVNSASGDEVTFTVEIAPAAGEAHAETQAK